MNAWLKRRVTDPLLELLRQGTTPAKLAQCVAFGVMAGVSPFIGGTTLLAAGAAIAFRLNMVGIQAVNYLVYPLQFVFLIPFFRAGEWLFGAERLSLSLSDIVALVRARPAEAFQELVATELRAGVAWLLLSILVIPLLTLVLTPIFARLARATSA